MPTNGHKYLKPYIHIGFSLLVMCLSLAAVCSAEPAEKTTPLQPHDDLYALKIDQNAEPVNCRTMPFLACAPDKRGQTTRTQIGSEERIPVGATASQIYLLGMINDGYDYGTGPWMDHPELIANRNDQQYVGQNLGEIEIRYADGKSDRIPFIMGATAWFAQWTYMYQDRVMVREPFISRPDCAQAYARSMKLRETAKGGNYPGRYALYYLPVKPRAQVIESIIVRDNPATRGVPLVSGVTLAGAHANNNLQWLGKNKVDAEDLKPTVDSTKTSGWAKDTNRLAAALYTQDSDLPKKVELLPFPKGLDATLIQFKGDRMADMLTNVWVANLTQIDRKFDSKSGFFQETEADSPWYSGLIGYGVWAPIGIYYGGAYGRSSDHFVTLALRGLNNDQRAQSYVDYCDSRLYYYRTNRDPDKGPLNEALDITKYPKDAPPHWTFGLHEQYSLPFPLNEIPGGEEMEGHGSTIVGRWAAWRLLGAPKGEWLNAPRPGVYGKSRWDSSKDAADFICWLMDYTGRDVIYTEGESVGWAGPYQVSIPKGMATETDPVKIKQNYANADMYLPYASYVNYSALRCSANMADAVGDTTSAAKWRSYAKRLRDGMVRLLRAGDTNNFTWKMSPYSWFSSQQDSLVQAWFAQYQDGLDPNKFDAEMTAITRNTLKQQLSQPYGKAAVLAMGYGQGWLTQSALVLDDMDASGPLLTNIARFSYDKNMDYVDAKRGIDWRKWLWLIPEGTNLLPNGMWHRVSDLSNGANQGPPMHAINSCAGVDDLDPSNIKILPRVPEPMTGIKVSNYFVMLPECDKLVKSRLAFEFTRPGLFTMQCDREIPELSVRLGPFDEATARRRLETGKRPLGSTVRLDRSGTWHGKDAWWIWVEGIKQARSVELDFGKD